MNLNFLHRRLFKQQRFRELMIICVFLAVVLGVLIVPIESKLENAQIKNLSDGLWWSIQTLTTVGYGDVTPVSDLGRLIGAVMQILGAILFGTLIAMIGSSMGRSQEEFYWNRLFGRIDELEKKLEDVQKRTGYLVKLDDHTQTKK